MLNEINHEYLPQKGTKSTKEVLNHEGTKFFLQDLQDDQDLGGGGRFAGVAGATPWGSKQAGPFRSELLRAQPVLIRRLCRLAKLCFSPPQADSMI